MKVPQDDYNERLFLKLKRNPELNRQKEHLNSYFKKPIWWSVKEIKDKPPVFKKTALRCCEYCQNSNKKKSECFINLLRVFKKAKKTHKLQKFFCPAGMGGFCLPLVQGDTIYGYIGLCHIQKELPITAIRLFVGFVDVLIKNIQKELELNKLYETIRPRAIALSTVHTIHRLISSTLDLDELLSRIARLSMQVMQANRCSVKLLDKSKDILRPVITIDRRTKRKLHPKELKLGKKIPGKAAKKGKVLRGARYLSIPLIDEERTVGVITIYDKINKKAFTKFDQEIMTTIAEQAVIAIRNAQLYEQQEKLAISGIKSLATILDSRGPGSFVPTTAFVKLVQAIGCEVGLGTDELRTLHYASLLHDAGQVFIPDEILSKPGGLTGEEYKLIKEHPATGAKIVEPMKHLRDVIPIILHHHENFDGSGYPNKLKGNQIPLGARIMAVASAFMSMITPKPYRPARSVEEAIEEIKRHSGTQFDPRIVSAFLRIMENREMRELMEKETLNEPDRTPQGSDIF